MSTEISTQTRPAALAERSNDAADFGSLVSMGDQLRRTGFLPSHIKDGVAFAAIVLMGREMGMGTMAACRKLQVIKGTVTERADSQLARFKSAGGRAFFKELTEARAVLVLRHPNGDEHTETFTIEDAKRAGLASNDNYAKHPKAMLRSRAITAGLKSIGWEGAVGIYDPDEIADHEPPRPVTVSQPSVTVHHVESFTPPTETVEGKARLAIGKAGTLNELDRLRRRLDECAADGTLTTPVHAELVSLCQTRAEMLISEDEAAQVEVTA